MAVTQQQLATLKANTRFYDDWLSTTNATIMNPASGRRVSSLSALSHDIKPDAPTGLSFTNVLNIQITTTADTQDRYIWTRFTIPATGEHLYEFTFINADNELASRGLVTADQLRALPTIGTRSRFSATRGSLRLNLISVNAISFNRLRTNALMLTTTFPLTGTLRIEEVNLVF